MANVDKINIGFATGCEIGDYIARENLPRAVSFHNELEAHCRRIVERIVHGARKIEDIKARMKALDELAEQAQKLNMGY